MSSWSFWFEWVDVVGYSPMDIRAFAIFIRGSQIYLLLISGPADMPSEEKVWRVIRLSPDVSNSLGRTQVCPNCMWSPEAVRG